MNCRLCGAPVTQVVCDLHHAPPSNAYLSKAELDLPEIYYPLRVLVCESCWLMQIDEYKQAKEIFSREYRYYSSYSSSWVNHASDFVSMIIPRLNLGPESQVLEIASNDGYLLQFFVKNNIPCMGIDPAEGPAELAEKRGVQTIRSFFSEEFAREIVSNFGKQDLVIGNNVLAHVPDINGFVRGIREVLAPDGTVTLEFPHLLELIKKVQFDTIYHEHYSYLSLFAVQELFRRHQLRIYDVERLPTHGGSLRVYACHTSSLCHEVNPSISACIAEEKTYGLNSIDPYFSFQKKVDTIIQEFLRFLLEKKQDGKIVVGYGAAAKANTLLNACGIKGTGLIRYVVDASPYKQGFYLPGSHIPIFHPDKILKDKPEIIVIFPWNIAREIIQSLKRVVDWECEFICPNTSIINSGK